MQAPRTAVIRPIDQSFRPLFQPKLKESVNSKYELAVQASVADENRFSFEFRSPGSQMLLSSQAFIDFDLVVSGFGRYRDYEADLPILRSVSDSAGNLGTEGSITGGSYGQMMAMGEADAFSSAIQSISVTCNSQSITSDSRDKFWRSLQRCWVAPQTMKNCYEGCGGSVDTYDSMPIGGISRVADVGHVVFGRTVETGIAKRCQQFNERSVCTAEGASTWSRTLRCRWAVNAGLFHPYAGVADGVFAGSPLASAPYGLCNYTQGSITILFKNFAATLCRKLGRSLLETNAANANASGAANRYKNTVTVVLGTDKPVLRLSYARLGSFRDWPSELSYAVWRTTCVPHDPMTVDAAKGRVALGALVTGKAHSAALEPIGRDRPSAVEADEITLRIANSELTLWRFPFSDAKYWDLSWPSISLPTIPSYLMIVAQKNTDMYTLGTPITANPGIDYPFFRAGALANQSLTAYQSRNRALNQASNLSIVELEIVVQNGQGSIKYLAENHPFQRNQDELYRATRKNCVAQYMENSGAAAWRNRCCAILLSSDQVCFGLSSPAVQYPITLSIRARAENRCRFQCGSQFGATIASHFAMMHSCPQVSEAVCVAIYDNGYQTISEGSSVISGFLVSQASAGEAFERNASENPL